MVALAASAAPAAAREGKDDRPEVRVAGTCGTGATSKLTGGLACRATATLAGS